MHKNHPFLMFLNNNWKTPLWIFDDLSPELVIFLIHQLFRWLTWVLQLLLGLFIVVPVNFFGNYLLWVLQIFQGIIGWGSTNSFGIIYFLVPPLACENFPTTIYFSYNVFHRKTLYFIDTFSLLIVQLIIFHINFPATPYEYIASGCTPIPLGILMGSP